MGYIYQNSTNFYGTTLSTLTPTANGLVYENGAYRNSQVEDEKHYVISESELKSLKLNKWCSDDN